MNLASHRRLLWNLCYRMTGEPTLSDDLVQETFARALAKPIKGDERAERAYLVTVATHLSRDALRQRRRREYVGPWLPGLVDSVAAVAPDAEGETRYRQLESVTLAFLLALERLNPKQRAVLLLREVFDFSVKETASAVGTSEDNVKQLHRRARRKLGEPMPESPTQETERLSHHRQVLERLMGALMTGDTKQVEAVLVPQATLTSDGGGHYSAALNVLHGARKVAAFLLGVSQKRGPLESIEWRDLNGRPALLFGYPPHSSERLAPWVALQIESKGEQVSEVWMVLAPQKLGAVVAQADETHGLYR